MNYLIIEEKKLQLDPSRPFTLTLSAPDEHPLDFTPRRVRLALPMSAANRRLLGDIADVNSRERFNAASHQARIEIDGCRIHSGIASIEQIELLPSGAGWYHFLIAEPTPRWLASAQETMLRQSAVEFDQELSPQTIRQSWTWDKPVRWLPVQRDTLLVDDGTSSTAIASERVLTADDYHPFLHIATLLHSFVEGAGYRLVSDFVAGEEFQSLYMSGAYPERDTERLRSHLDFLATRHADISATADRLGVVVADPYTSFHSLGNLVDGAPELNTGGVFRVEKGRIAFIPAAEVSLGFEYRLCYRTSYKIRSREQLSGFDMVYLGDSVQHRFQLINRFEDRRTQLTPNKNHLAIVFDHAAGEAWELRSGQSTIASFTTRSASVTLPAEPLASLELWHKPAGGDTFARSNRDWALYDGYIEEEGETIVDIRLPSAPERVTPGSPKYFNAIYFGGAWEGARLTLLAATTIRPLFAANPALGSRIRFDDVAAHAIPQSRLIEAIAHLFDLRITTDELIKEVHIEPHANYYRPEAIVDWSERIDSSQPIRISEPGAGMNRLTCYAYRPGDGYVTRYNAQNATRIGEWKAEVASSLARPVEAASQNPLFTPTLSLAGNYRQARSAQWMQVGERADYPDQQHESLNFPAKIVRYHGLQPLPAGELWGWPSYVGHYPLAAFHLPGRSTLCFEDRDGMRGLHRYYEARYDALNSGRRITASLRLRPSDIEAIVAPSKLLRDMRATFRIRLGGQRIDCRLEQIHDFDPFGNTTQCTFITL